MPDIPELADSPPEVDDDALYGCEHCERAFSDEDNLVSVRVSYRGTRRHDTRLVCDRCRWQCADCSEEFLDNLDYGGNNTDGDGVCESCSENYFYCESCGCTNHNDHCADDSLCDSCADDLDENADDGSTHENGYPRAPKIINNYSYKPRAVLTHAIDETVSTMTPYFGVEIEAESTGSHDRHESVTGAIAKQCTRGFWYAKDDGSLDNGAEFVSHPATWKFWSTAALPHFEYLQLQRWRSYNTTTCGMHVHISRTAFSKFGIVKLMRFFRNNAQLVLALSRRESKVALDRYSAVDTADNHGITYKVKKPSWGHAERYAAINLENANTVEIRVFRGTLDAAGIRRNIALCYALVHFVRWAGLQQLTAKHFAGWLRGNGRFLLGREHGEPLIKWVTQQVKPIDKDA